MEPIWMKFGEPLLLWTLITMVPTVFGNFDFKGNFSQSIISRRLRRLLDSKMCLWTQILYATTIYSPEHDGPRIWPKLETFGKFWNKVWVPPIMFRKSPIQPCNFLRPFVYFNRFFVKSWFIMTHHDSFPPT